MWFKFCFVSSPHQDPEDVLSGKKLSAALFHGIVRRHGMLRAERFLGKCKARRDSERLEKSKVRV